MALPAGLDTVTVTIDAPLYPNGQARKGQIRFTPAPAALVSAGENAIVAGPVTVAFDGSGVTRSAELLATDAAGVLPSGWTYTVEERWADAPSRSYSIALPAANPAVNFADLVPTSPAAGEVPGIGAFGQELVASPDAPAARTALGLGSAALANAFLVTSYGATGDGVTDDTVAIQSAIDAADAIGGGYVVFPEGTYICTSSLTPKNRVSMRGEGANSRVIFTGTGAFITIPVTVRSARFESMRFTHAGPSGTLFYLDGCFRNTWLGCTIDGKHYDPDDAVPSANILQNGFELRNNAGDNRIIDCDISNLGAGIRTSAIMNAVIGTIFGSCWWGVYGDAGSFAAGMTIDDCVFTSGMNLPYTTRAILIDVPANQWWVSNTWIEGADVAVQVGDSVNGGPVGFSLFNAKLSGTSRCLDIQHAKQASIQSVRFSVNPGATPTALTINSTNAPEGYCANIIDDQVFRIPASVFPAGWTYVERGQLALPSLVERNLNLAGVQVITPQANTDIPLVLAGPTGMTVDVAQFKRGTTTLFLFDRFGGFTTTGNVTVGGMLRATGSALSLAAGANNGSSPPAPASVAGFGSNNVRGQVSFGSGSGPSAGAQVVVTFSASFGATTPTITLSPSNAATQALGLYISALSPTGFTVSAANAPAASQAASTYQFGYHALG